MANKLLSSVNEPNFFILGILHSRNIDHSGQNIPYPKKFSMDRYGSNPKFGFYREYDSRSIGYLLISNYIRRSVDIAGKDLRSMLSSLLRTAQLARDESIFYMIDCTVSFLLWVHRKVKEPTQSSSSASSTQTSKASINNSEVQDSDQEYVLDISIKIFEGFFLASSLTRLV